MRITTFFLCHNVTISSFDQLYFLIFSHSLSHTIVSPGIATFYNHCLFLHFNNYHNISSSGFYHVITLYVEIPQNFEIFIFNYTFWLMFIPKTCPIEIKLLINLPMYIPFYTIMPVCTPFELVSHIHLLYKIWFHFLYHTSYKEVA